MKRFLVALLAIAVYFNNIAMYSYGAEKPTESQVTNKQTLSGDSLFAFKHNDKWGYMDKKGNVIIKPKYDRAEQFSENLACVSNLVNEEFAYGYINTSGELVVPMIYSMATSFRDGAAQVLFGFSYNTEDYAAYDGLNIYSDEEYDAIYDRPGSSGPMTTAPVKNDGKRGIYFIDPSGKRFLKLSAVPIWAESFSEGLATFTVNVNKRDWKVINKKGEIILDTKHSYIGSFSEGLASYYTFTKDGEKAGFIDKTGKVVIKPTYEMAGVFSEGLAVVLIDGKYGYINKNNKIVIPAKFTDAHCFSGGIAKVMQNGNYYLIDKSGKAVLRPNTRSFTYCRNGMVLVDSTYYLDLKGNVIKPKI